MSIKMYKSFSEMKNDIPKGNHINNIFTIKNMDRAREILTKNTRKPNDNEKIK